MAERNTFFTRGLIVMFHDEIAESVVCVCKSVPHAEAVAATLNNFEVRVRRLIRLGAQTVTETARLVEAASHIESEASCAFDEVSKGWQIEARRSPGILEDPPRSLPGAASSGFKIDPVHHYAAHAMAVYMRETDDVDSIIAKAWKLAQAMADLDDDSDDPLRVTALGILEESLGDECPAEDEERAVLAEVLEAAWASTLDLARGVEVVESQRNAISDERDELRSAFEYVCSLVENSDSVPGLIKARVKDKWLGTKP